MKNYKKPASKQGMTAKQLVHDRLVNLNRLMQSGKQIQDTDMTRKFIAAYTKET